MKKIALSLILTIACLMTGYGFYKMNDNDLFSSVCFTIGILGLMASVVRNKKEQIP